jgi:VWFA-related protein
MLKCLMIALMFAAQATAQDPIGGGTIRTETKVVLVDAVVTDKKGNFVHDLAQKDFKVFEDGKEQAITSFSVESSSDSAGPADRRHYLVLFFDNSTVGAAQTFVRQAATKFVDANAGPDRLIAVAEFNGALVVTQNFTDDVERLKQAIGGAKFSGLRTVQTTGAGLAAQNNFAVRSSLEALKGLARGLSKTPGRKTVILISGGFPATTEATEEITSTIQECNRDNVALFPIASALGDAQSGSFGADDNGGTGGRSRGGGRGGGAAAADLTSPETMQQSLFSLATGTGGYVIVNTNDIAGGMQKIGREQDEYYLLGYTPAKDAAPGLCHALKVKLDKSGTNVRSRAGYCEEGSQDVLSGTPAERDLEVRMNANASPTVTGASLTTPFFYTGRNTARVHVVLEMPPGTFEFVKDKGKFRTTMNVVGIAWLPDGTVKARFSDAVRLAFDDRKQVDAFGARPFQYEKQFPIGPGQYTFKVVFSSAAKQLGRLETPLSIEPWDPSQFALSAPALSTSVKPAKPKVDGLDPSLVDDRVLLTAGGYEITPMGSHRLKKSDRSFLYAELYEPAMAVPGATEKDVPAVAVHMELLDPASGAVKKDFGLIRLRLPPITGSPTVPMGLIVTAPELDAGPYKLRLTALDDKQHQAVRTLDIQLEN